MQEPTWLVALQKKQIFLKRSKPHVTLYEKIARKNRFGNATIVRIDNFLQGAE
jgi:hypothetical protein